MVEYSVAQSELDALFHSLADGTRRDVLRRVSRKPQTISELAQSYAMSFAAIAKHITVLERAKLVTKQKRGKEQVVSVAPKAIKIAAAHLEQYEKLWEERFNRLDKLIADNK